MKHNYSLNLSIKNMGTLTLTFHATQSFKLFHLGWSMLSIVFSNTHTPDVYVALYYLINCTNETFEKFCIDV